MGGKVRGACSSSPAPPFCTLQRPIDAASSPLSHVSAAFVRPRPELTSDAAAGEGAAGRDAKLDAAPALPPALVNLLSRLPALDPALPRRPAVGAAEILERVRSTMEGGGSDGRGDVPPPLPSPLQLSQLPATLGGGGGGGAASFAGQKRGLPPSGPVAGLGVQPPRVGGPAAAAADPSKRARLDAAAPPPYAMAPRAPPFPGAPGVGPLGGPMRAPAAAQPGYPAHAAPPPPGPAVSGVDIFRARQQLQR